MLSDTAAARCTVSPNASNVVWLADSFTLATFWFTTT